MAQRVVRIQDAVALHGYSRVQEPKGSIICASSSTCRTLPASRRRIEG